MYDRCGAIINRVTDPAMIPYIHIEGTELLACIGSDSLHAANDIRGLSVLICLLTHLCWQAPARPSQNLLSCKNTFGKRCDP